MRLEYRNSEKYKWIGISASTLWALCIIIYIIFTPVNILNIAPNELGDFLAGALGPLGILWIVLGFWQQGDELRNSVKALNLQSDELRASVDQQKQLVSITREQAQAEIEALHEERAARRRASHPNFALTSGGGSTSRDTIKTYVTITNVGASVGEVVITSLSEGKVLRKWPLVSREFQDRFELERMRGKAYSADFAITYAAPEGGVGAQVFRFSADNDNVGFKIDRVKTDSQNVD